MFLILELGHRQPGRSRPCLWLGIHALDFILRRARKDTGNLAASGMQAFGMLFKTVGTAQWSSSRSRRRTRTSRWPLPSSTRSPTRWSSVSIGRLLRGRADESALVRVVALVALAFPQAAFARGEFDPVEEFEQHDWVSIHLGPLDLSITKAVVYLMLGTVVTIFLGIFLMRVRVRPGAEPGVRQTIGEQIYEVAQVQIAEQGLPTKAIHRWFPYVASLFLFIFVVNLLGLHPPAADGRDVPRRPGLGHLRGDELASRSRSRWRC